MADEPRDLFEREALAAWHEGIAIQADTAGEIERLLRETAKRIEGRLADQPTDYQQWYLPRLRQEVTRMLDIMGEQAGEVAATGASEAWAAGVRTVDRPFAAVGIPLETSLPRLDESQLRGMRQFLTTKMRDVSAKVANRIDGELGLVVTGLATPFEAATAIAGIVEKGGRKRALTVVRTELGRAFEAAGQERKTQAVEAGIRLKKQWRRSGKIHSRRTHDLADGQVVDVDQPFLVAGEKLMYPKDPQASAANTVNCGCASLPYMASWEMLHPGEKPFSPEEENANPAKRDIAVIRGERYQKWAGKLLDHLDEVRAGAKSKQRTQGDWQTVGTLPADVVSFLEKRGLRPATMEIAVGDKHLARMRRTGSAGKAKVMLPKESLFALPDHLRQPKAIYWGEQDRSLHYVFDVPGDERLGHVVVRPRAVDARVRQQRHNFVVSGGLVPARAFHTRADYAPIRPLKE